ILPGLRNRSLVDFAAALAEEKRFRRHIRVRAVQSHVALALLFGIVKRMRVQERPDKLAAYILEPEFKMRVLIDRVMPAVKRGCANVDALLVCNFFRADQALRVARSRRSNRRIVGMRECIAQRYDRRTGIDQFSGARRIKHSGLGCHDVDHSTRASARTNFNHKMSDHDPTSATIGTHAKKKRRTERPAPSDTRRRFGYCCEPTD